MNILPITTHQAHLLVPIFSELERYYFGHDAASECDILDYLQHGLFADHSGVRLIAASVNDQIVGFATYTIMYPAPRLSGQMYMKDLFVSQQARGLGVGEQLMKSLAREALDKQCLRLDWTAETTNPGAAAFYQKIHATQVAEKQYFRFEGDALKAFAKA